MRIIKDNYNKKKEKDNKVICECWLCGSEFEVEEHDTYIGAYGAAFVTCPCCGKEAIVDQSAGIELTKDNIEFPKHFRRANKELGACEVNHKEIQAFVKIGLEYLRRNKPAPFYHAGYGDTDVIILKMDGDEEYSIIVTKDKYTSYVPFEEEDYE